MPLSPSPTGQERDPGFALVVSSRRYNTRLLASILLELRMTSLEQRLGEDVVAVIADLRPRLVFLVASQRACGETVAELAKVIPGDLVVLSECDDPASDAGWLRAGADLCIHDEDHPDVALAMVQALVRRRPLADIVNDTASQTSVGVLTIDWPRYEVKVAGRQVQLTLTEFQILSVFAQNADMVLTPREVIEQAIGRLCSDTEARDHLKVFIRRLRRKLAEAGMPVSALANVRGFGYMLQSRDCRIVRPPTGLSLTGTRRPDQESANAARG